MNGISPSATLAPAEDATSVAVADEQFVFNTLRGSVHRLSGTAATVWQILDGRASLLVLADELAEAYGADPVMVLADLERLGGQLTTLGLATDLTEEPDSVPSDDPPPLDPRYVAVPPNT